MAGDGGDLFAADPLKKRGAVADASGAQPARRAASGAAAPISPGATQKGLRWYLLIALAVGVLLARGETGAPDPCLRQRRRRRHQLYRYLGWSPPYTGLPLISLHPGDGAS